MTRTPIQWLYRNGERGFSINPIRFRNKATGRVGHYCEKISPGCKFCYADAMQTGPYLSGLPYLPESFRKGELFLDRNALDQVLRRRKPTAFFWCDMTDLFGRWVPFEWIDEIISAIVGSPQHRHMILTKRPDVALEYFGSGRHGPKGVGPDRATYHLNEEKSGELAPHLRTGYPLAVWIGVSVEDQERKSRLDLLRKIPADYRFVSFEPLLEDLALDYRELKGFDLLIWGGESGSKARDCYVDWIREGMAAGRRAGAMNFVKQLGRRPCDRNDAGFEGDRPRSWPMDTKTRELDSGYQGAPVLVQLQDPKGGDMEEWPPAIRVRELPV